MEIKIPKEVRQHKETIFFGLSARQFFCAAVAVGLAVALIWQSVIKAENILEPWNWYRIWNLQKNIFRNN